MTSIKSAVAQALAYSAVVGAVAWHPAHAQTDGEARVAMEEIVVTARLRAEGIQTVPVSISAFSAEALERAAITDLQSLAHGTPGLIFTHAGEGRQSTPVIRGLAQTNPGGEANVPTFLDGVFLSNRSTIDIEMLDLERIEVVRGPQSALYGQNAFAGAINYISRPPSESPEARLQLTAGGPGLLRATAAVSGPVLADQLYGRLAVGYHDFDGTYTNIGDAGSRVQGRESVSVSGALEWRASEDFTATLFGYYSDFDRDPDNRFLVANNCGDNGFGGFLAVCGELPTRDFADLAPGGTGMKGDAFVGSLRLNYQFSPSMTLTSISSFQSSVGDQLLDFGLSGSGQAFPVLNTATGEMTIRQATSWIGTSGGRFEDFSQELRFQIDADRWNVLLGGFYYDHDESENALACVDTGVLGPDEAFQAFMFTPTGPIINFSTFFGCADPFGPLSPVTEFDRGTRTLAAFGQIGVDITDTLRASVELRRTREKKFVDSISSFGAPGTGRRDATFSFWTPRISVDFQARDDLMVYASAARGGRSGGFNANFLPSVPEEGTFGPEFNWTYEMGAKSTWLDGRVTANVAVFYIDWTDLQIRSQSLAPDAIFVVVRNTGNASSKGVELGVSAALTDWWQAEFGYAFADPKFSSGARDLGQNAFCVRGNVPNQISTGICDLVETTVNDQRVLVPDVSGNQLARTSRHQVAASSTLNGTAAAGWSWYVRGDLNYQSRQAMDSTALQYAASRTLFNARVALENGRYELALWGQNLFDTRYVVNTSVQPRFHDSRALTDVIQGDGRKWGLTLTARFQ